ncbi:MAG: ADP-ribosylation factor-like protein [Candidatus Heimdallarchaeaceae archaeon]
MLGFEKTGQTIIPTRDLTVTIAGLDGSGKTSIVKKILKEESTETFSTFGISQEVIKIGDIRLGLTDLGGKEPFRKSLWGSYISKSDALIYVIDATNEDRLAESKKWFVRALKWVKKESPVLLLINTWDTKINKKTINSLAKLFQSSIQARKIDYFSISPITGFNVNKTVNWLANTIISHLISVGVAVDYFVAYIKTDEGIVEARIRTPGTVLDDEGIFPFIRYRFAEGSESVLEYMRLKERQVIMASDSQTSCWLVTTKSKEFRGTNLLMKLLTEFVKEIHGLRITKGSNITESDLTTYIINYMIDKQTFWSEKQQPMFEISLIENQ